MVKVISTAAVRCRNTAVTSKQVHWIFTYTHSHSYLFKQKNNYNKNKSKHYKTNFSPSCVRKAINKIWNPLFTDQQKRVYWVEEQGLCQSLMLTSSVAFINTTTNGVSFHFVALLLLISFYLLCFCLCIGTFYIYPSYYLSEIHR